jgi:hypothetical protein
MEKSQFSSPLVQNPLVTGPQPDLSRHPVGQEIWEVIGVLEGQILRLLGKKMKAAPASAWNHFLELSAATQQGILSGLHAQSDFIQGALDRNIDGLNEFTMLRYAMDRMCLLTEHDTTEALAPGDVIEIFDPMGCQVYRSYNCFSLSNYSLLELTSYPWFELYDRSHRVEDVLIETCEAIVSGKVSYLPLYEKVPDYTLRELRTDEHAVFAVREKFAARMKSAVTGQNYVLSAKMIREVASESAATSITYL